jgi:predicted acyltransferase
VKGGILILASCAGVLLGVAAPGSAQTQPTSPPDGRPVLEWQVLGPLSTSTRSTFYRAQLEVDYLAAIGGERTARLAFDSPVAFEGRSFRWQPFRADEAGRGEIRRALPDAAGPAVFYAATTIESAGGSALLKLSSVSSERAWLNGRRITDLLNPIREMETESVTVPVQLEAGRNLLLLKVSQTARIPGVFGVAVLPGQTVAQRAMAWLPFLLLVGVWAGVAAAAERVRAEAPDGYAPGRLVSLDALRGFDMFWITGGGLVMMLLAQTAGNHTLLEQFDHQTWNGFHFWDLIFPLFLFIVGAAIPFAFAKRLDSGAAPRSLHGHIVRRSLALFAVGIFLAGGLKRTSLADLRIAGVLQRIAVCYLAAALLYLHVNVKKIAWLSAGILLGYWAVMALVPVPGSGAGIYLPDRNLANWLDLRYLPGRMYQGTWDNEGIISTFPAVVTCLIGVLAGCWLRTPGTGTHKTVALAVSGVVSLCAGWVWNLGFPVNKLLWSSSYVLVAAGWSLLLLAAFYWVLDVKKWRRWSFPFVVVGANAIGVYAFEGFINFSDVAARLAGGNVAAMFGPYSAVWLAAVTYLLIWGLLYWLYKRRIFIRL